MSPYQKLQGNIKSLIGDLGIREGHVVPDEKTLDVIQKIYSDCGNPQNICEIGFNAGHSAACWLTINEYGNFHSVDNGFHNYTLNQMKKFEVAFPDRFSYTLSDSKTLTPEFYVGYDLVIVDGGHDWPSVQHDYRMAREAGVPYILFDDYLIHNVDHEMYHRPEKSVTTLVDRVIQRSDQPYYRVARYDIPTDNRWLDPARLEEWGECKLETVQILLKRVEE